MDDQQVKELKELLAASAGISAQLDRASEILCNELFHAKAWHSILSLFFVRYYAGFDEPIQAAMKDRDFLAKSWREYGKKEEVAVEVERVYQSIVEMLENLERDTAFPPFFNPDVKTTTE